MRTAACIALTAALGGCSSILPKAPAETYYDLRYEAAPVPCQRPYGSPVEIWNFSAAGPYDRSEMVVTEGRAVSFSQGHQWVDRPGVLVAQSLMRDLGAGTLFPLAVPARDPQGAPLELTGNVYRFAWEKEGGAARAHLEVDVVLRRTGDEPQVLLHRRYDVRSDPVAATDDSSAFARAMSGAVARFSTLVRDDLCGGGTRAERGGGGGAPDGGVAEGR